MAQPPVTIFSQHRKPDEVLKKLLELLPGAAVEKNGDGVWTSVTGTWKRGWLKGSLHLEARHDPGYYAGKGWGGQLAGMSRYFRNLAGSGQHSDIFGYLPGLNFAVSFILNPGTLPKDDPRQEVIHEIARRVDGVIFLPGMLLDAEGRALLAAEGERDPEARLPAHQPLPALAEAEGADEAKPDMAPLKPPSEARVIARLVLMGALVNRGFMETHAEGESMRAEIVQDLRGTPAWQEGEPDEIAALETPAGELGEEAQGLPWLSEGAAVLAWALGLMELPAYDEQVEVQDLYKVIDQLEEGELRPQLRAPDELDTLSFQMLAIHWRLRQFQVEPKAMDFKEYAPRAWCGPMDLSLARLAGNDLAVCGKPLSEAAEEEWKTAAGIMHERRMAIHWLLGHATVYSENDTGT